MRLSKEVKLGVVIVATIAASFFVINFLRGRDLLNREELYHVRYDDMSGLKPSAFVYYHGYKVGVVRSIDYNRETGDFETVLAISRQFEFPADSYAEIYSSDLMGGKSVRIVPGVSETIASGTLSGRLEDDPLSLILSELPSLVSDVSSVLSSVDTLAGSVNSIMTDNREVVRELLESLHSSAGDIDELLSDAGEMMPELQKLLEGMSSFVDEEGDLTVAMSNFRNLSQELSDAGLKEIAGEINELLETLNSGNGTAGKLLSDEELYERVDMLVADVDSLVKAIKENPKKYIRVKVF